MNSFESHDLVACSYNSVIRLGLPSKLTICFLIMKYYFPFSGFWVTLSYYCDMSHTLLYW